MCSFLFCKVGCFTELVDNMSPTVTPSANVSAFGETRSEKESIIRMRKTSVYSQLDISAWMDDNPSARCLLH